MRYFDTTMISINDALKIYSVLKRVYMTKMRQSEVQEIIDQMDLPIVSVTKLITQVSLLTVSPVADIIQQHGYSWANTVDNVSFWVGENESFEVKVPFEVLSMRIMKYNKLIPAKTTHIDLDTLVRYYDVLKYFGISVHVQSRKFFGLFDYCITVHPSQIEEISDEITSVSYKRTPTHRFAPQSLYTNSEDALIEAKMRGFDIIHVREMYNSPLYIL